jgi:hypothetical protein
VSDDVQPFSRRAIAVVLAAGAFAAAGFLLLSAYAPDLRSGRDGGGHAMSNAATGFRALFDLNVATGGTSTLRRSEVDDYREKDAAGLLILTPPPGVAPDEITKRLADRASLAHAGSEDLRPTLIVLPKWITAPDPARAGWVQGAGLLHPAAVAAILPGTRILRPARPVTVRAAWDDRPAIRLDLPAPAQAIAGPDLDTIVADPSGGAVLARMRDRAVYVLADPDILDNRGMKNPDSARGAVAMLAAIDPATPGTLIFDVSLNGFGRSPNLLKLAFEPPFLGVTLCLLAAGILAGLHAIVRFGPAHREARGIAFGKTALLDGSADLIRRAGREGRSGERYLALTRDAVATATGTPADRIDAHLGRLVGGGGQRWADLADRARAASTGETVVAAARALHQFKKDVTRDRG